MKYAIILPDGAADQPVAALGHRTPLHAAHTPHMDWVADHGIIGLVRTTPDGYAPGSDVCTLSLMGVDVARRHTGRAPLEAAGRGLELGPGDVVFRCNLVTIVDGCMVDFTAGHITQAHAGQLIAALNEQFHTDPVSFHEGVGYRHLMVVHDAAFGRCQCTPPHDIPHAPVVDHLPRGDQSSRVREIMDRAARMLAEHPVNRRRLDGGQPPANRIWLWGQGTRPGLDTWSRRFGLNCAGIAAVDLIRGIDRLLGFDLIDVPGATGYLDTDYAAKGRAAVAALEDHDLVSVHVEAPDEAGHQGDVEAKVAAIERIDQAIVGPVLERLRSERTWGILVAPDHPTCLASRVHSADPPPFAIALSRAATDPRTGGFCEPAARAGVFEPVGHQLIHRLIGPAAGDGA